MGKGDVIGFVGDTGSEADSVRLAIVLKIGYYKENSFIKRLFGMKNNIMNPLIVFTQVSEEYVSFNDLNGTPKDVIG